MQKRLLALTILPSLLFGASAAVKHVAEHGFVVENTVHSNKSKEQVWLYLTTKVDNWWPKDHTWWGEAGNLTIDSYAGGCFCERAGNKSAEHMHISFVEPGKLLRMSGGLGPLQRDGMYGALDWELADHEDGTQITLRYSVSGLNPDGFESWAPVVDRVQLQQLNSLKVFADKQ